MKKIIRLSLRQVKPFAFIAVVAGLAACSVIPPQQEHYMLRADYFRGLEEQRKTHEAEKTSIRERHATLLADVAREEGRRLQVEGEAEDLRRRLFATETHLAAALAANERGAKASREEKEMLLTTVERLNRELETTRAAMERMKMEAARAAAAEAETSVVLITDIVFARNASAISRPEAGRIRALARAIADADHISVVGHAETRETPDAWRVSAARAAAVAKYIVDELGAPMVKVTSVGRGSAASAGVAVNRRVEIIAITAGHSRNTNQ
jgi:flagellar motor protein MotB